MESKKIWLKCLVCSLLVACCIPLDSINVYIPAINRENDIDVQYFWLNSIIYAGIFGAYFIGILSAYPCSTKFVNEYNCGIWRYLISRSGVRKYVIKGLIQNFFYGGITSALGSLLFIILTGIRCQLFDENRIEELNWIAFYNVLKVDTIEYFVISIGLIFVHNGILSMISYIYSYYAPVKQLVYVFPFIFSFFFVRLMVIFNVDSQFRIDYVLCGRSCISNNFIYALIIILIVFSCFLFCYFVGKNKLIRRLENE